MPRSEIEVKCNNGTKFRIQYRKTCQTYLLSYRNDKVALPSYTGQKCKGQWLWLEEQANYADCLAYMFEEIASIDAKEGND